MEEDRFSGDVILLHGPPKIGKSTLATSFPRPILYIAAETAGVKYLNFTTKDKVLAIESDDGWSQFKKLVTSMKRGLRFETVIVDTVSMLFELCKRHHCKTLRVDHPSDKHDHGATWSKIGDDFLKWVGLLSSYTVEHKARLILVAHSKEETIETDMEKAIKKITVALPGQAARIITARPDHIWYMGYGGMDESGSLTDFKSERALWIQGTSVIYAESRDRGLSRKMKVIDPIPEKDTYQHVLSAYSKRRKIT